MTLAVAPIVLAGLRRFRVMDDPNARSSHSTSTPRGGGLAIAVGITAALAAAPDVAPSLRYGLLVLGLGVGSVGLIDDVTGGIPAKVRLVTTLAVAASAMFALAPASAFSGGARLAVAAVCVAWVACYVNAFNFMDGINGISGLQVVVVAGAIAVAAGRHQEESLVIAASAVAASALAFLPFNFPVARMFLGDVGSYLLGALVAGLVIAAIVAGIPPEAAAAATSLYAADTFVTLMRRVRRGEVWHQAHREHVYQQLTGAGLSHAGVAVVVALLASVCAVLGVLGTDRGGTARLGADAAIGAVIIGYFALPTLLRRAGDETGDRAAV